METGGRRWPCRSHSTRRRNRMPAASRATRARTPYARRPAYVHKIVTGRAAEFSSLRQRGGLSGYPSRAESVHDWVEHPHASTALSYAQELATGLGSDEHHAGWHVVAVVRDGVTRAHLPGPVDEHGILAAETTLRQTLGLHQVAVVHEAADNGRGWGPAETDQADRMHGIGALGREIGESGAEFEDIVRLSAAMRAPAARAAFADPFPGRSFDVGTAKGRAVFTTPGMAVGGLPVVARCATFLSRALDQVLMRLMARGRDTLLPPCGPLAADALEAARQVRARAITATVADPRWILPVPSDVLELVLPQPGGDHRRQAPHRRVRRRARPRRPGMMRPPIDALTRTQPSERMRWP